MRIRLSVVIPLIFACMVLIAAPLPAWAAESSAASAKTGKTVKKAPAKKTVTKKTTTKKVAVKKPVAKKAATKKTSAKKTATKKAVPKKKTAKTPVKEPAAPATVPVMAKTIVTPADAGWRTYNYRENGQDICYMMLRPSRSGMKRTTADKDPREEPVFMVSFRPSESVVPIVNFKPGYGFKNGSEASLTIDKQVFRLFTVRDGAWARTAGIDRAIVDAMLAGKSMVAQGSSLKGSKSADQFDLKGTTAAYRRIAKACKMTP